jgi:hypothetical protein
MIKGARFADVAAIQESVTAALRSIPKEAFVDSFEKLYERCEQCVPFTELSRQTTYNWPLYQKM